MLSASYVSGHVHRFPTAPDGALEPGTTAALPGDAEYPGPVELRQDGPHAHCYQPLGAGGHALCADLGSDALFALDSATGAVVGRSMFPPGSGPRHVAVAADAATVYVSCELGNLLVAVPACAETGTLGPPAASASILPPGYDGPDTTASHVELSPCGGYAYVGNRVGVPLHGGCEEAAEGSISVLRLDPLELLDVVPIGGKVPRGFCVVDADASAGTTGWLVVGAQESSLLRSFAIGADGGLTPAAEIPMPSPGCVVAAV